LLPCVRSEPIRDPQTLADHATAAFTIQRYTHHYDSSARHATATIGHVMWGEP
jgi:hypothetical protein